MAKRVRKPNFTQTELLALVEGVQNQRDIILGKFSDTVSNEKKKREWQTITNSVNAVSNSVRTVDDIRKKWQDWASVVKGKEAKLKRERKKTGGGKIEEKDELSELEERVIEILGVTAVHGISSDITDTFNTLQRFVGISMSSTMLYNYTVVSLNNTFLTNCTLYLMAIL